MATMLHGYTDGQPRQALALAATQLDVSTGISVSGRSKRWTSGRQADAKSLICMEKSGARGIRTLDTSFPVYRISNAAPSAN
jgi:hypothetical protein